MTIYLFIIILIMIASALLVLAVLAQHPKGGMAANFGSSNQVMGVRQTANFLEKFTWGSAITILVLSVMATMFIPTGDIDSSKTRLEQTIQENSDKETEFSLPMNVPVETGSEATESEATETTEVEAIKIKGSEVNEPGV